MSVTDKVDYDFDAAADLSRALHQLNEKVTQLINARNQNCQRYLDAENGAWTGIRRTEIFDREFKKQQQTLAALAEEARTLMGRVDRATEEATAKAREIFIHG